jgi:hypothetical protein
MDYQYLPVTAAQNKGRNVITGKVCEILTNLKLCNEDNDYDEINNIVY